MLISQRLFLHKKQDPLSKIDIFQKYQIAGVEVGLLSTKQKKYF